MDLHHHRFFNILTFSLPLFCFLLSWGASSTDIFPLIPPPPPPPPSSSTSSALSAADTLRIRGYTLFASTILSTLSTNPELSGTILAPPDFAFSFATAKFSPTNRRAPPRPSTSLLLFHTLKPPSLTWLNLSSSRADNDELPTLYNNLCLFFFKTHSGEISISSSKKPILAVKIRQPDLYVDDNLIVHGIDGVLDPATANKCSSFNDEFADPTAQIPSQVVNRSFLDHAIRVLKRRGFNVAATALAITRSELLNLTAVTVFAPSDRSLFLNKPDGFRYDFLHHVVQNKRLRFNSLARLTEGMTAFKTLALNKTVIVESINGAVRVNGVLIDGAEIYHNRWIVVFAISTTLDDADGLYNPDGTVASSPPETVESQFPGESTIPVDAGIFPPAPLNHAGDDGGDVPSVAPASEMDGEFIGSPETVPSMSPAAIDALDARCASGEIPIGVEGEDLFCPATTVRKLQEKKQLTAADVDESRPSDWYCQLSEKFSLSPPSISQNEPNESDNGQIHINNGKDDNVNIADDLFFYV